MNEEINSPSKTVSPIWSPAAAGSVLDALESLARRCSHTRKAEKDYRGQVAGTLVTDSQAIGDVADSLEVLADHGRFRVAASMGRMVVGYWPENDPLTHSQNDSSAGTGANGSRLTGQ